MILEDVLKAGMFKLDCMYNISEIVINEEAVNDVAKPLFVHADYKEKKSAAAG